MILSNQVECLICHDKPFSAFRHDYKECTCGSVAVDGGMSYLRRVFTTMGNVKELSIEIPDEAAEAAKKAIREAIDTGRNELGILCAVARALRDNGVQLVEGD